MGSRSLTIYQSNEIFLEGKIFFSRYQDEASGKYSARYQDEASTIFHKFFGLTKKNWLMWTEKR